MRFGGRVHSQVELKERWEARIPKLFKREVCRNHGHKMTEDNTFYMIAHGTVARLCRTCKSDSNKRAMKKFNAKNKAGHNQYEKSRVKKYRDMVLGAYGAKCSCCGETRRRFLTVEHLEGDGHQHRARLKQNVYYDIVKQGFPKDKYGVLCMNCNFAKGRGKQCPHEIERLEAIQPYPGQEFFRELNPRIRRAEENWEIVHGLRKAA